MARSGISTYLDSIGAVPLLTPEQEIDLGRKVQRMVQLEEAGRELTFQEQKELRIGQRALDRFVKSNLRLVVSAAKKYVGVLEHMDLMDLVQEGNIGLMVAVRRFDPGRGYKFSTYAYWWIRQSMARAITAKERYIRLPGKIADMGTNWSRRVRELSQELKRMPTTEEMAESFDVPVEEVRVFLSRGKYVSSLDVLTMGGDGSSILDLISDPMDPDGVESMDKAQMQETVDTLEVALGVLTPKERSFVERRWGLGGAPEETYIDIGRDNGISRERVRQVVDQAQRKMRFYLSRPQKPQQPAPRPRAVGAFR
jgi:RNA polymerase primary sigma factor